jgi:hypothetical protein
MRKTTVLSALALGAVLLAPTFAQASSHREAPFVTKNPKTDGTDFYMFDSYDPAQIGTGGAGQYVTFIANYQPFQDPWGGPNYFTMDPDALYEIMIDNNGDGIEDLTFQFQFQQALAGTTGLTLPVGGKTVAVPLVNIGPFSTTSPTNAAQNVLETYTVNLVTGPRRTGTSASVTSASGGKSFAKPFDNVGPSSFGCAALGTGAPECANYATYANQFIYKGIQIPGCSTPGNLFVGQRQESFAVNIGPVFDLVNASIATITGNRSAGNPVFATNIGPLNYKNVTTLAIEVPISCLLETKGVDGGAPSTIIGGWTTASVPQARLINPTGSYALPAAEGGAWAQVSRLGMPLVNEVVIGLPDKDLFNSSEPKDDLTNFATYIEYPTLPLLIQTIFGATNAPAPTAYPRLDLVTAFATGVTGVNANGSTCEYTRLNTAINPSVAANQNNLGAALCFPNQDFTPVLTHPGCDPAGFPNGRRPGDDILDITLRVAMGYFLPTAMAGASQAPLTDAILQDVSQFGTTFPYLNTPNDYAVTTNEGP